MSHENDKLRFGVPADAIVMACPVDVNPDDDSVRYYGGLLVCESASAAWRHRIVSCVNACAGIPDDIVSHVVAFGLQGHNKVSGELEGEKAASMNYRSDAIEAMRQRDELLAALEAARNGLKWYQDAYPDAVSEADGEEMARIDTAIANAKGSAPAICSKCNTPELCREYGRACAPYPGEEVETSVPAIVFYPSGSLGESVESEGGEA